MFTPSTTGSQGFTFDLPGIEASIVEWKQLADALAEDEVDLLTLNDVQGPGDEFSSEGMARKANQSISAFIGHLGDMQKFVDDYVVKLTGARDEYLARDGSAAGHLGQQGHP